MADSQAAASFQNYGLAEPILEAIEALGFESPTPIQAASLPESLAGKDLIGCAQTGTGKTAAFLLPLLSRLIEQDDTQGLILAPTRELALQIQSAAHDLAANIEGFRSVLLIGGVSLFPQKKDLARKPRLIVGTPGRIVDHLRQGSLRLNRVNTLILDEADRMLDMGFLPQLNAILEYLPEERQTMLFSATMPHDIVQLAKRYLRNPARVTIGEVSKPVERITQDVIATTQVGKSDQLLDEINRESASVLVFTRTKRRADRVARFLSQYGLNPALIHGDRSQRQRDEAIARYREGDTRVLVATDIASRGIDIPEIHLVVNYDLPDCPEDYVHRIGRTARAGRGGRAVLFVTAEDREEWRALQKFLAKKGGQLPDFKALKFSAPAATRVPPPSEIDVEAGAQDSEGEMQEQPAKPSRSFSQRRPRSEGWGASRYGGESSRSRGRGDREEGGRERRFGGNREGGREGRFGGNREGGREGRFGGNREGGREGRFGGGNREGGREGRFGGNREGGRERRFGGNREGGRERRFGGGNREGGREGRFGGNREGGREGRFGGNREGGREGRFERGERSRERDTFSGGKLLGARDFSSDRNSRRDFGAKGERDRRPSRGRDFTRNAARNDGARFQRGRGGDAPKRKVSLTQADRE